MGLLTTLFVVRAAQLGQLQRWEVLASKLSDDPFWLSAAFLIIATVMLPVPRSFLLGPAFLILFISGVELNPGLFFGAVVWLMQTLQLVFEMLCGFKEFLLCSLSSWKSVWSEEATAGGGPRFVDCFAAIVFQLWMASAMYKFVGMRLERFLAKQKLRSLLQTALKSPFRATFKPQAFTRRRDSGPDGSLGRPMRRTFSGHFLEMSEEQMESFREKHFSLLQARRSLLGDEENDFPEEMLPACFEISVSRNHVLEESYQVLQEAPLIEFLAPTLTVKFRGEEGEDRGGVTQDWFSSVGQALAQDAGDDASLSVFAMGKSSRMLIPRPVGKDADDKEGRFRDLFLAGRFLALAVLHGGRPLPLPLSPLVCKYMVGKPVDLEDVKCLDLDFYRQRVAPLLQPEGLSEVEAALGEPLTFLSVPTELRPAEELEPGGSERVVTEENLDRYLMLLCEAFLCGELREELQCLLKGFWDLLPLAMLQKAGVEAGDLSMLLMGSQSLDLVEWRRYSEGSADAAGGSILEWFWEVLKDFDEEQRRLLLRFCTGSSRVPPGGFQELQPNFTVEVSNAGSPEHLPHAHTCVNKLVLHKYTSKGQLCAKLLQALPTEGFGFA